MKTLIHRLASRPEVWVLTALAALTRLWGLFSPAVVVFDEVYFKTYAGSYLTGSYYFDPHPPLAKLLLGGVAWLFGLSGEAVAGNDPAVVLRLLPAVAGIAIIPLFYLLLRQLRASRRVAALGALLLLLDNALLAESRFILTDSLLIVFGLAALCAYLAARRREGPKRLLWLAVSAFAAGLTISTKWTGLAILALIGLAWFVEMPSLKSHWRRFGQEGAVLLAIPAAVYFAIFALHFSLLPNTGQGDAFMSVKFQQTLKGSVTYNPATKMSAWDKFWDLNQAMHASEEGLKTATHPYGSKWYTWPVMERPIYYWQGSYQTDGRQGNIYLIGNPVIWWGILLALVVMLMTWLANRNSFSRYHAIFLFLIVAYAGNFLPFAQIQRVMFLYHYFFAFIFSLALAVLGTGILAGWMDRDERFWHFPSPESRWLYLGVVIAAIAAFVYFAPLTYGWPLTPSELLQRAWLPTWR